MMNLRKKQYEKGFYLLLNKGYLAIKFQKVFIFHLVSHLTYLLRACESLG